MTGNLVVWGGLLVAACALHAGTASACGGGGVTTTTTAAGVVADTQRVFMSVRASGKTDIVVQIGVPDTSADYGVLIPVPDEPVLDPMPLASEAFDRLDAATAPKITTVDEAESESGGGCGCPMASGSDQSAGASKGGPEDSRGVAVSPPRNIGPVSAVVLRGDDGAAVDAWLDENGFALPDDSRALLDEYSGPGKHFIAIKRATNEAAVGPTSIGLHYVLPGDHRDLSLRFARMGAAQKVAFTIFLAVPEQTMGPSAPFTALTLQSLDAGVLRAGNYAQAVERAVAGRRSQAFVLEGSWRLSQVPKEPSFSPLIEGHAVLTRLSTVIAASALQTDVNFGTPFGDVVTNERYVFVRPPAVRYASMAWVSAALLGGALRRRLRPNRVPR